MNESSQKRQIQRFLKGHDKRDIDAFCIYQWIERCHIQKWWEMGIALAAYMPPDTLENNYQKRLEFILNECRKNFDAEQSIEAQSSKTVSSTHQDKILSKHENTNYAFPTHLKETSPIHYINYLVCEKQVLYFDEVARILCTKFHDGNLRKSKQLLYNHSRHRGIKLK